MKCDVYDASSGDARTPLWSGVTTLLSRNKATIEKQKSDQLLIASQPFLGEIGKQRKSYEIPISPASPPT